MLLDCLEHVETAKTHRIAAVASWKLLTTIEHADEAKWNWVTLLVEVTFFDSVYLYFFEMPRHKNYHIHLSTKVKENDGYFQKSFFQSALELW